ncbi:hypothetical protein C1645_813853, partial [Glomus cerebriforme]
MNDSWTTVQQNFSNDDNSWPNANKSNNLQVEANWERQNSSGNWGTERPSATTPSENNLIAKRTVQESWGQNKSENSWVSRNDSIQVDQSWQNKRFSPQKEPAKSASAYNKINDQQEEKLDSLAMQVGIQQSYESLRNDDYDRQQIILEEDNWDPSYDSVPTSSKPQLGKSIITSFNDEIPFNTSDVYKAKGRVESSITSPNSTFQELPRKEFRNVEVQTDPIDLSLITKERLFSCTIGSPIKKEYQDKPVTNNISEKRYPSQQISLLDVDPEEWNTKVEGSADSWKPVFREGTAAIPPTKSDTNSRSEVTQWSATTVLPKPGSDSWDSKPTPTQNDSWNTTSQQTPARNDNRGTVPQPIPVLPDSWDSTPQQTNAVPQRNARNTVPDPIPVLPDSWDSTPQQTTMRNDNRGTVPQPMPVLPDSWDSTPQQTDAASQRNARNTVPAPIPVQPD